VHLPAGELFLLFRRRLVLHGTDGMSVLQQRSRSMGHRARLGLRLRDGYDQRVYEPSLAVSKRTRLLRRAGDVYG
jgi:hypothetical protein